MEIFLKNRWRYLTAAGLISYMVACSDGGNNRTWTAYKGDETSSSYSPLEEINMTFKLP